MTPPPIRYPLPSLILLILVGLLVWKGEEITRPLRREAGRKIERLVKGPPVPASSVPKSRGEVARKGLLLREGVDVFRLPKGEALSPIAKRGFVSIYDEWSSRGESAAPEFYRVGTRVPIGWIAAADLLPWDTRLVHLVGSVPLPIVGWSESDIEVIDWENEGAWRKPANRRLIKINAVAEGMVGVLVAQIELPALLKGAIAQDPRITTQARLDAVLGELTPGRSLAEPKVAAAFRELPGMVQSRRRPGAASERIAALNAELGKADVSWGDRRFRFVPLEDLP